VLKKATFPRFCMRKTPIPHSLMRWLYVSTRFNPVLRAITLAGCGPSRSEERYIRISLPLNPKI